MKLLLDVVFFIIIGFYIIRFIQVFIRMGSNIVLPTTPEERAVIRTHPDKVLDPPTFAKQKVGIMMYSIMLLFIISMYFIGLTFNEINWSIYLLVLTPLTTSSNLLNLFAITRDGIMNGMRFVPWHKIKSYEYKRIDLKHKYYGFSKEVNNKYELVIKTKSSTIHCFVTSDEMKKRLGDIIDQHIHVTDSKTGTMTSIS